MSSYVRKIKAGRIGSLNVTSSDYVGEIGTIFYDESIGDLRVSDGVTPGGIVINTGGNVISTYGNVNVQAYIGANVGAYQLYANAAILVLQNNAAAQTVSINSLTANAAIHQALLDTLTSNAAVQAVSINNLTANAAIQQALLDTLTSNAASQSIFLNSLTSNAATQADSLAVLISNAASQQTSLIDLLANAAVQSQQIANVSGTYNNANVKSYMAAFDGNIIPSANVTYSLGDATHQWKDLWISNNTIYIGNTPVRVEGGTLLVNGAPVSGGSISSLINGASTFQLFANGRSRSSDTIFAANGVSIINANGVVQGGIYNSGDANFFNIGASNGRGIKFYVNEETDGPQFTANGVVLPTTGTIKNTTYQGPINLVSSFFSQLQWTTGNGVLEADPNNTNQPTNWLYVNADGTFIETNKNGVVGDLQTWLFDLDGNTNVPGNVATTGNVMTVGTANARMNFDTVNRVSTMRVRQSNFRNIDNEDTTTFGFGIHAGLGTINIGWLANQALYHRGLLSRLTEKFQQGYTDFYHEYSNIKVEIYGANANVIVANVTNVTSDFSNPPVFTITVDQLPNTEPYTLTSFNLIYDFDNVMGFDANLANYGISVDDENIVMRTNRDITLNAVDDFRVYAGSSFTMNYIRADGQGVDDGMLFRLTDNGSDNDTYFQFDGTIHTAANLRISPLSLYAPAPGTKIIQGADEILELVSTGNSGQTTVGWTEVPNGTANIAAIGFNALVNGGVNITAGNLNFATASSWLFDKSGNLTLPNGTLIRDTGSVGTSGLGLGNHGFNIDFGSAVNDWAIMSGARLIQVQPDETFNIAFPEQANWQFANTGNLTFPDGTVQTTAYTGAGGVGTYGNANVQALLASNVSLIGSSSTITLATLGASSTTTVSQEGGGAGYGVNTISGSASNSPGFALVQPGWTVTGNNLVGTTTVISKTVDGFGSYTITTDTAVVDPFWYNDVYTFTSNTPSYSNLTVSSGNIINAGTYGQIQFVANSSGDGYGLSTMRLVPYTAGYDSAYIVIDPTYPNHIHIRAGGPQDNSPARLFLGGEVTNFSVDSGLEPAAWVTANNHVWTFGTDGSITFPTGGDLTFDACATSVIDGVTNISATGTIGANVIQVLDSITSFGASPAPTIYGFRSIATTGSAVNEGNISASGNLVASQNAYITGSVFAARYNFANGVNILSTVGSSYGNTNVAAYLSSSTATVANLIITGSAPASLLGSAGDTAGMIRVDSNYLYHCYSTYSPSSWTVGWGGALADQAFLTQGDYPTPQVGWTISQGGNTFSILTVTDTGYGSWQMTISINYGSPTGGTAVLTNPNPATIWTQTPLAVTNYANANVSSYLSSISWTGVANAYVAIGTGAGITSQGLGSVAVGLNAGNNTQGYYSVAVGIAAGRNSQGDSTVAIGGEAGGDSQGTYSVAVGYRAGRTSQAARSIILNATGANLNAATTDTLTVAPIRNAAGTDGLLQYNNTTKEVTYSSTLSGNLTVTGNITQQSAYYETFSNVSNSGGNLTCNFVNSGTFYATLTSNVTLNFTGISSTSSTIVGGTIIVNQGVTPYQISNVQINGGSVQSIRWAGGAGPNTGTGSNIDIMSFSLINLGNGSYHVLGQISNYG